MEKVKLSTLIYSPLMDIEENVSGWNKQTVDYALSHKTKVKKTIIHVAATKGKTLQRSDIDDCFANLMVYLYKVMDYDISIAAERSRDLFNEGAITLEAYVLSCAKYVTIKYVTNKIKRDSKIVENTIRSLDNEEVSIFDTIADDKDIELDLVNTVAYGLEDICKMYESQRYKYSIDIFELWFIRLLTNKYQKKNVYKDILEVLGIERWKIRELDKNTVHSGIMLDIAKAVSMCELDEAIEILRGYTYSADKIEKVIQLFD